MSYLGRDVGSVNRNVWDSSIETDVNITNYNIVTGDRKTPRIVLQFLTRRPMQCCDI